MRLPGKNLNRKLSPFFSLLSGKHGKRVAFATVATIALEGAAIGLGIATLAGAFPVTVAISAIGPLGCGIGIAFATASSISQRKAQKKEHKAIKKEREDIAEERKALEVQRKALEEQGRKLGTVEALERQILANQTKQSSQPAATKAPKVA